MTETENTDGRFRSTFLIYLAASVLGSGVAYAISSMWLELTTSWVAWAVGASGAVIGVIAREYLGEAIILSLVLGLLVSAFVISVPGLLAIKAGVVPGACGFVVGNLIGGVCNEIAG